MTHCHYKVLNRQGMFIQSAKPRNCGGHGQCRCGIYRAVPVPLILLDTVHHIQEAHKRGRGHFDGFRWSRPPTSGRPVPTRPYVKRARRDPFAARSRFPEKVPAAELGENVWSPLDAHIRRTSCWLPLVASSSQGECPPGERIFLSCPWGSHFPAGASLEAEVYSGAALSTDVQDVRRGLR